MGARDEYAATIKSAAANLGTHAAMTFLKVKYPFLANPFLGWIAEHFVSELLEGIIVKGELGAFFYYVDLRATKQGREFYEAAMKRQNAKPEDKEEATREMLTKFVHFTSLIS